RLKGLARALDGGALVLAALAVAVLAAGRLRLAGMTLERAEDLVVVLALVVGARLALAPVTLPRMSPRALVAGGVAVYVLVMAGFATRRLGDARAAAGFAVLYLLNPTLHGINVRDVHPTAFAIPLVIAAAWAVDAGRPAGAAVAVVAALAGREDAAIAGVGFGVWLAAARRRWVVGVAMAIL